jgi:hypothetical protein
MLRNKVAALKLIWLLLLVTAVMLLSGCSQIASIPYSPAQTPETWLQIQPFVKIYFPSASIILVQPTTSAIVYLLGIITIAAGVYFLRIRDHQRSRFW